MGLRYIDRCPVPSKNSSAFQDYYNTTFPLERFPLEDAIFMDFKARVRKDGHFLTFREFVDCSGYDPSLVMDFDGHSQNVEAENYLTVCDDLHDLILAVWKQSIKEPVYEHMRKEKEYSDART